MLSIRIVKARLKKWILNFTQHKKTLSITAPCKRATIMILIALLSLKASTAFSSLADNEMALESDKVWMQQQLENLKSIKPLVNSDFSDEIKSDNVSLDSSSSMISPDSPLTIPTSAQLLIFISFSMPEESLKALAKQAKKVGGVLVLRGLVDNSVKKTLAKIVAVFGKEELNGLTIDPLGFQDFGIKAVPAIVVTESSKKFDIIYGDVSLYYALKKVVDEGEMSLLANSYLRSLKE